MIKLYGSIFLALILSCTATQTKPDQKNRKEIGNLVIEGIPQVSPTLSERLLRYQNIRACYLYGWDPTGTGLFFTTRFGETSQVHVIEKPGGARTQITFFKEPVESAARCTNIKNNTLLLLKDVGGNEFYQIFEFDLETGRSKMLTDGKSRNGYILWSNKGDKFACNSTRRNNKDTDVFISTSEKPLVARKGWWAPLDWSADDKKLLVLNYVSSSISYLFTVNIEDGKMEQINPKDTNISYDAALWAKDGKGIYYTSDEQGEFKELRYYDIESKKTTVLTNEIEWDIEEIAMSKSGKTLAFVANEDGISKLYLLNTADKKYRQVSDLSIGQIYRLRFSPNDTDLAFCLNTPQTPGDIYTLDTKTTKITRWTFSEVGGLRTDSFVVPTLFHYETFDQINGKPRTIPAFYYKPKSDKKPFPVLIDIHGGPSAQFTPTFTPLFQYLVCEMNVAVICPNVRGSSGYGKTCLTMDDGYKREDSVKDIGALIKWIEKQPELDSKKIGVSGGSYGGYMVYATMIHYNDKIKAGISIVGISNFVTFLENTAEYRRDLRRVEYGDERDKSMRDFLIKISPTTNAHKITKPLFIAQGLNDPRVPSSEAEQILEAVKKNGGEVWYLLAKDEGHGFSKRSNRNFYFNSVAMFWNKFLLN